MKKKSLKIIILLLGNLYCSYSLISSNDLPLYWWIPSNRTNFGDELSHEIVKRIIGYTPRRPLKREKKLLALGSIMHLANDNDIVWGTGVNGKAIELDLHKFTCLDVRAVRGPLTRQFLLERNIPCPEIYGDPALLMPLLFPEFKPTFAVDYIVIPHIFDVKELINIPVFNSAKNIVLPTENWETVVKKILESKFVIASSLHGIIVAEAFGIPARYLRATSKEPLFKYVDYYTATGRPNFKYANSIAEALEMGGEDPIKFDANALLKAFPYEQFTK